MRQEEHRIQCAIVKWFYYAYPAYRGGCLFAVPNGGHRNIQTARSLKAEGVTSGVSDLLLLVPKREYHGLCIEVKTPVGRQSENQKSWQRAIEAQGYKYSIVRSLDEFVELVRWYLNEPPRARLQGRLSFG
jgi:hypothetical protein